MTYRFIAMMEFGSEGQALDMMAQAQARAVLAQVVGGSHTSYARVDGPDGLVSMWHVDIFGIVRSGEWVAYDVAPAWIQPTGAHDSYPVLDASGNPARVMHGGKLWENTSGTVNSWEPGVAGWTEVSE